MKRNLLNNDTAEHIIARVQKLQPSDKPLWGKMTPTEMLLHLNRVHQLLLTPSTSSPQKTSLKHLLIRWLVLYVMPRYPKGAKTPAPLRTKGAISEAAFAEQKQTFIELIRRFAQHHEPIQHFHPYFGALSTQQWGLASWKHADHHLRQFGL
jgi:hypothetical protein